MILETLFSGLATSALIKLMEWAKKHDDERIRAIIRDELAKYSRSPIQVTNIDVLVQQVYLLAKADTTSPQEQLGATKHKAKQWHMDDVPALVDRIYDQVLERHAELSGLLTYGAYLKSGERSVREIMKEIGCSAEYREHFIEGKSMSEVVELCYEHFLGRRAEPGGRVTHEKVANTQVYDRVIKPMIESDEYARRFGEDIVPTKVLRTAWDMHDVPALVERIYDQVLERGADSFGLVGYGSLLHRGERSVREIIKDIGLSPEYEKLFMKEKPTREAVELCYVHFLGRRADDRGRTDYERIANTPGKGIPSVISAIIDSDEYKRNFGEDSVPPKLRMN